MPVSSSISKIYINNIIEKKLAYKLFKKFLFYILSVKS